MSHVLHDIEKQIIKLLQSEPNLTEEQLSQTTTLSMDQIRRGVEWLRQKDLADVTETTNISYSLGKNGLNALKNGLPERRLVALVKDVQKHLMRYEAVCRDLTLTQQLHMRKRMTG